MAEVWAARVVDGDHRGKCVAIKTILPGLARDPDYQGMLVREARLAARFVHPNACAYYELGDENGVLFLAMEWVEGGSLSDLLAAGGVLDLRIACRVVADASAGLHALHELADEQGQPMGAVHRDVSPENILVSVAGEVKVTDFGISKVPDYVTDPNLDRVVIRGKVAYMAPEQAAGEPVDRRSDVFALGCVLYQATIGFPPFRGKGLLDIIRAVLQGQFTPPEQVLPGYPVALSHVIEQALTPNPDDRLATAKEFQRAVEHYLAGQRTVTCQEIGKFVHARVGEHLLSRRARLGLMSD